MTGEVGATGWALALALASFACAGDPVPAASGAPAPPPPDADVPLVLPARAPVPQPSQPPDAGPAPVPDRPAPGVGGPDFAMVFEAVSPSVLTVIAGRLDAQGKFEPTRNGTGFVWDASGHIVTNAHLIAGTSQVRVRTLGGVVKRAALVGIDSPTDLAVLAVEGVALRGVHRGDVRRLRPGQWVAAIGNPYGMQHSITVGVVSAVGRRKLPPGGPRYADFVQTDLNINPGNSGGPLVDARGRVVGLNTAVLGRGQGLAFAIPIDMVAVVADRLLSEGRFVRGFAGLFVGSVGPKTALAAGLEGQRGARVTGLVESGPATRAGLAKGDIIVRFDDTDIDEAGALPWVIARTRPGARVSVRVARGPDRLELTLDVAAAFTHHAYWRRRYQRLRPPDERHSVRTADGWVLSVGRIRPAPAPGEDAARGTPVILCPGVACNSRLFDFDDAHSLARALTARGFDVWMLDPRGTGESERAGFAPRRWRYGFAEYVRYDAPAAIDHVVARTGHDRILWVGHSMGGLVGYWAAAQTPAGRHLAGVVGLGSPADFSGHASALGRLHGGLLAWSLRGWPAVRMGWICTMIAPLAGRFRVYPETLFISHDNVGGQTLRHFCVEVVEDVPRRLLDNFSDSIYRALALDGGLLQEAHGQLGAIDPPVLAVAGDHDYVAPPSSVLGATRILHGCEVTEVIVGGAGGPHFGHLDLLVGDAAPVSVYPTVVAWLLAHRPPSPDEPPAGPAL